MQKYPNSSGSIGLEDFEHWPSDGDAVGFLAMTTSATSLEQRLSVTTPSFCGVEATSCTEGTSAIEFKSL